jgi:copper(I)-binding protein
MNEEAFAVIRASFGKTAAGRLLLGAGVLALLVPAIAGCEAGADAPTQEFHSASSGAHTVFNGITITNAFVLAGPTGSTLPTGSSASLFVSLYNGGSGPDQLESISTGWAGSISLSGGAVSLPANAAPVNLTGPQPEVVLENLTKPLAGGTTIQVKFKFAHAGSVTLPVPVEPQSFQWATFSAPAASSTGGAAHSTSTATPLTTPTPTTTGTGTGTAATSTATPTSTATSTSTATP